MHTCSPPTQTLFLLLLQLNIYLYIYTYIEANENLQLTDILYVHFYNILNAFNYQIMYL